jgi:glycosyltransferase involved in cell wall biosynthesis
MMPAYNAEAYIKHAIESLLAQTYPHWELIIVNDGSTDGTADIAIQFTDSRIKLIHQRNGGEASARNTALKHMQGEFVAFLDADDLYLPHHLDATVKYLQDHPDCDGVYTDGHYCDHNGNGLKTLSARRRGPFEGRVFEEVVYGSDVFGPPLCVVLRRNLINQHSLEFDEDITIGPDWVFFTQYADVARFGYIPQFTCLYRVHQTNITARTGLQKRASELAKCRMRTIKMGNFKTCSLETRMNVFYDLLANLLRSSPGRQLDIIQWPEFTDLPPRHQAKLLRLMASKAILYGGDHNYIADWLRRSRELDPGNLRGILLAAVYRISPSFCKSLLRAKSLRQPDPLEIPPFADLGEAFS